MCEYVLYGLIDVYFFVMLVVNVVVGMVVNYLLFVWQGDVLCGYVVCGNELVVMDGVVVLVIFFGLQGYVSLNWYLSKYVNGGCEVFMWNYVVVYVYGCLCIVYDVGWLCGLFDVLIDCYEVSEFLLWKVVDVLVDYVEKLFGVIVGIEIVIECIEGKFKFSQNYLDVNCVGVIGGLIGCGQGDDLVFVVLM